jgi:hypothetical protein
VNQTSMDSPRGKKVGSIFAISEILENVSPFLRVDNI